jgi:hypothetical protein
LLAADKLLVDAYGYFGNYTDFIVRTVGVQSNTGNVADLANPAQRTLYSVPINSTTKVKTYGYGISLDYRMPKNFNLGVNFTSDVLQDVPEGFIAYFNAPKYRTNISLSNNGFGTDNRLGFNVVYRWQDAFYYESDFISGQIEDIHTLDAQFSYRLTDIKSVIKIGGNNILNQYYRNAAGNPSVGGLYYVSFGYNIF